METRIIAIIIGLIISTILISAVRQINKDEVPESKTENITEYIKLKEQHIAYMKEQNELTQLYIDSLRIINERDCDYLKSEMINVERDVNKFIATNNEYIKQYDSLDKLEVEIKDKEVKFEVKIKNKQNSGNTVELR